MATDNINNIVDVPIVKSQFDEVNGLIDALLERIKALNGTIKAIEGKSFSIDSAKEGAANLREGKKAADELTLAMQEYEKLLARKAVLEAKAALSSTALAKETAAVQLEVNKANKANMDAAKAATTTLTAYQKLEAELKALGEEYKEYYLTLGEGDKKTIDAQKRHMELYNTLSKIDANLGRYTRNVGNYASGYDGLGMSLQQILREAPSAAVSMNTFFLAISNNLPMFFDQIMALNKANKAAEAAANAASVAAREQAIAEAIAGGASKKAAADIGELAAQQAVANTATTGSVSVLASIGRSLFSFNTLLTVGVTLLTLYGGKIWDWAKTMVGAGGAAVKVQEDIDAAMKESNKSTSEQIAKLETLNAQLSNNGKKRSELLQIVEDYQKQYPEYLSNINLEDAGTQKLNDSIARQIELIKQKQVIAAAGGALAKAIEEENAAQQELDAVISGKSTLYFSTFRDLMDALAKAQKHVAVASGEYQDAENGSIELSKKRVGYLNAQIAYEQHLQDTIEKKIALIEEETGKTEEQIVAEEKAAGATR